MKNSRWNGTGKPFFNSWRLALSGVFLLAFAFFVPSLSGGNVWEDSQLIEGSGTGGKTLLEAFTHPFLGNYYRPLTSASFILDRFLADDSTRIYHLTNVLFHAATAVLICWLTLLICRSRLAAILAGVCFALQPAQVGAVAWIGGRTDTLSCLFMVLFLASLIVYQQSGKIGWCLVSAASFIVAVLAKEQTYALLPAVPASVFVFGDRKWRHAILLTIPFFFAGILWFGLSRIPGKPQGAMGDSFTVQLPILTAADYGAAFAAPTRLTSFLFSLSPIQNALWIVLGIAALAAAGGLGYFLWKRHPRLAWVYLCAILLYLPVSNFLPIPSFWVAPYRMAETGICLACLFGVAGAYAYRSRRFVLGIPLAANLAMAACASVGAEQVWHSSNGFNSTVLAYDPHFFQSGLAMVDSMARQKKTTAALAAQNDMICYMLSDPNWESDRSPAQLVAMKDSLHKALQTNYGWAGEGYIGGVMSRYINLLLILHRTQEAQSAILTALDFTPQDADLNYEYGWAVMSQDRAKALQRWELAMMQRPKFGQCAAVLGHERFKDGNYAEAAKLLALAGETAPTFGSLWVELADARVHIGDYDGALTALETASPNYADQNGLATRKARILALMGRPITASAG